jgi:hypothetical protein
VKLFHNAHVDLKDLANGILDFANWWNRAESYISSLKLQIETNTMSLIRTNKVRTCWEDVRKTYLEYKVEVRNP